MKTIVLISCVSQKQRLAPGQQVKAKDLYVSNLFKKAYAYANQLNPDKIYILSAKYGLLEQDDMVTTYDETLNKMPAAKCRAWAQQVIHTLKEEKHHNLATEAEGGDKFILLAGKKYYQYLLGEGGIGHFERPYEGCKGIGYILHFLSEKLGL